jgi:hypothetical protein
MYQQGKRAHVEHRNLSILRLGSHSNHGAWKPLSKRYGLVMRKCVADLSFYCCHASDVTFICLICIAFRYLIVTPDTWLSYSLDEIYPQ